MEESSQEQTAGLLVRFSRFRLVSASRLGRGRSLRRGRGLVGPGTLTETDAQKRLGLAEPCRVERRGVGAGDGLGN